MLAYTIQLYKNAYTGLSKNSWYLGAVMLINRAGTMVVPFLSIYCIQQLHFSVLQAGAIMTLYGAGALSGSFAGGKLVDKIGFYDLQIAALTGGGLLFMLIGFLHSFIILATGTLVLSFCNESVRPANSTAIAHYSTASNTTRSYSLNRLAINLGWAVGGGLGGFLAAINYHLLFWVDGCTNVLAAVLLLVLMPRSAVTKTIKKTAGAVVKTSAYKDKVYLWFIGLGTLYATCFYQFMIMQPVFFKIDWHFSERIIGLLMALNGILITVIEMVMVHKLEGRRDKMIYIYSGIALCSVGFALLNILPATVISALIVVVFITFSEMLAMPFMNTFWVSRTTAHNRGEYAALYSMSWSAAQIIAPFLGSTIIYYGGFTALWWLLGGVCLVSSTGYWVMYRGTKTL
ncbi:MFS transporter [Mucilaginibacter sp. UR6-11]|uniref:MFS transporter n=1 Tax=Mucilaginibacter sp. UR6-11 TaxID=1435644 RepID=UPI001E501265|nr:MFS transporter [Mucilaginibacter sp. UR6-11]MCC8423651.1 MFS transporter [Mucilaginibacter sp. UR6-11]